jgi:predicted amidohydrolase
MGLTICYDLRFPELYRALVAKGAQMVFVPSAFTAVTGEAHWEPLLRARAIENQVYIIAPDQTGKNPRSFATYGNSMIVDPWGRVLARAPDFPGVILAEIDLNYLAKVRAELPSLSHRRIF